MSVGTTFQLNRSMSNPGYLVDLGNSHLRSSSPLRSTEIFPLSVGTTYTVQCEGTPRVRFWWLKGRMAGRMRMAGGGTAATANGSDGGFSFVSMN